MTAGTIAANTISRASPVIRDSSVVAPTTAVLRKKPRFIAGGAGREASWGRHGTERKWAAEGGWRGSCREPPWYRAQGGCGGRMAATGGRICPFPLPRTGRIGRIAPLFWSPRARGQYQVSREASPSYREAPSAQRGRPVQAAHRDQERRQRR